MDGESRDEELFRAVFEGTLGALLLADDEGRYVDANAAAVELFGVSREEILDASVADFAPPGFDVEEAWSTFLEQGEMRGEYELHLPDGEVRTVEYTARADVVPGVHLSALRDVTEWGADRARLDQQTELLARVFETSPVGIVVTDADGRVVEVNDRAAVVLGIEAQELRGRRYGNPEWGVVDQDGEPIPADDLPVARVLATGEAVFGDEHGIDDPSGGVTWQSVNAAPIHEGGSVSQVVATVEDVTDRREYQQLLEVQNARLEAYSATVSHDLRGPLSVAAGWVDLAMAEETTEDLHRAKDALDRMESLISDLRELGRYGQTVRGPVAVDLADVAREAWTNIETAEATLEVAGDLGSVHAEEGRLLQLFENLYRNAVEHAGPDATVRVGPLEVADGGGEDARSVETDGVESGGEESSGGELGGWESGGWEPGGAESGGGESGGAESGGGESDGAESGGAVGGGFYVEDDGPGIPAAHGEEVFEFGFSTSETGSGLGLAIVEAVADAHGWDLRLTDADPQGARFEFEPRWHPDLLE